MQARDTFWLNVCGQCYPTDRRQMTAAEVLQLAGYAPGQFALFERGRRFQSKEPILVNGREFDVEFTG